MPQQEALAVSGVQQEAVFEHLIAPPSEVVALPGDGSIDLVPTAATVFEDVGGDAVPDALRSGRFFLDALEALACRPDEFHRRLMQHARPTDLLEVEAELAASSLL
jgi:hypothetical protein